MIISFNPQIFQVKDTDIQRNIARILISLVKTNHFLDISNIDAIFFNDSRFVFNENEIASKFLSKVDISELEDFVNSIILKSSYLTQLHKNHLTQIKIGMENGEITPNNAQRILEERSKVIVENGINDWKFIKGVCKKYVSHKQRGSIYNLISHAIHKDELESDHSGGIGEIVKIAKNWIESRYKEIFQYKLIAIFDSDRDSSITFKHEEKVAFFKIKERNLIQLNDYVYGDDDMMYWHIWYKRGLENYLPLSLMFINIPSITALQRTNLEAKTSDELDFIKFDGTNVTIQGVGTIKEVFPNIFESNFSYKELEERCKHHRIWSNETQSEISEFEQILLKIAKIT